MGPVLQRFRRGLLLGSAHRAAERSGGRTFRQTTAVGLGRAAATERRTTVVIADSNRAWSWFGRERRVVRTDIFSLSDRQPSHRWDPWVGSCAAIQHWRFRSGDVIAARHVTLVSMGRRGVRRLLAATPGCP